MLATSPLFHRRATQVSVGTGHTCALTLNGGVKCWGDNGYGQLGNGTSTATRLTPVDVIGLNEDVQAISLGWSHSCALTTHGGVKCWGENSFGQLGDGTSTNRLTPVEVIGLGGGVHAISAGYTHACAVMASGSVKCWGYNFFGQLGDGSTTNRLTPVAVVDLADAAQEGCRRCANHTCARVGNGSVRCWGSNYSGQLGDGTTTDHLTPVAVVCLAGSFFTSSPWDSCTLVWSSQVAPCSAGG